MKVKDFLSKTGKTLGGFFSKLGKKLKAAGRDFASQFHKPTKAFWLKSAAVVLLFAVLATVGVLSVSGAMKSKMKDKITETPTAVYDCILVLGAKVHNNQTPSDILRDRLEVGIDLYFAGVADKIMMSGDGEHDDYDEVSVMKAYAVGKGVPEADILVDRYGLSTYESMWRAKNVFGLKSVAVVTQEYHLTRSLYIADRLGMKCCGVPSDLDSYKGQFFRNVREVAARFKDFCFVQSEKIPEYSE